MMNDDNTQMGGSAFRFPTTQWTAIDAVESGEAFRGQQQVGELIRDYWKPVYCYLRRKGYKNEDAKDLTQGFLQEVVLGRKLIQRADRSRGRFRSLLLTALDHYLANVYRHQNARKRIPRDKLLPLDRVEDTPLPDVTAEFTSEGSFNYAWVSTLLDRTLAEVEDECGRRDMTVHWQMFRERVLQPLMENREAPSMAELCSRYGIDRPTRASNMIFSVKRRLQSALKRQIRQSVASDAELAEEMELLWHFFKEQ